MRALFVVALSSTLLASAALAAETGPLAPGKPAGVKQAQMGTTGWVLIGIGAVAGIAIGVGSWIALRPPTESPNNTTTGRTNFNSIRPRFIMAAACDPMTFL